MKKYICIKGSPEIPKGSIAALRSDDHSTYDLNFNGHILPTISFVSVEQNDCWEEVKEEAKEETSTPVKQWKDLEKVWGFTIDEYEEWDQKVFGWPTTFEESKTVFATENQARSCLAMAQLSQLMKQVNGEWKPDWKKEDKKYVIDFISGEIHAGCYMSSTRFLAFPTAEICYTFLENHRELIEEYFLMYQ